MPAHILVVDDNPLNVKLLAAKLARDYYTVSTAENGQIALNMATSLKPDLILLDVMMPVMDGFEACKRLKDKQETCHIPIVMVTALSDVTDRVRGLEVGADDFLTKPINDIALMARVRSLVRLKLTMDEWRLRETTAAEFALSTTYGSAVQSIKDCHVLILEDDARDYQFLADTLKTLHVVSSRVETAEALMEEAAKGTHDLLILSLNLPQSDGLMVCAQLRATEATRSMPILVLAIDNEIEKVAKALDLGANDYLLHPMEGSELVARVRTQLLQKRHYDRLRSNYAQNLTMALVDPLTGAFNRRYMDMHLPKMFARADAAQHPMSVLMIDIDHFKQVNDKHGHNVGDIVLKEVVNRMMQNIRPMDLMVRMGGEEFAVVMPETDHKTALIIGERLRTILADKVLDIPNTNHGLAITASFGASSLRLGDQDNIASMMERADKSLYTAKHTGRNKVVGDE